MIVNGLLNRGMPHFREHPLNIDIDKLGKCYFDVKSKLGLKSDDKSLIETVYIPQGKRGTICISSQVGCTLNCTFCNTGTQKLVRNLSTYEILGQIFTVIDHLNDWPMGKTNRKVTNLVMMGMG